MSLNASLIAEEEGGQIIITETDNTNSAGIVIHKNVAEYEKEMKKQHRKNKKKEHKRGKKKHRKNKKTYVTESNSTHVSQTGDGGIHRVEITKVSNKTYIHHKGGSDFFTGETGGYDANVHSESENTHLSSGDFETRIGSSGSQYEPKLDGKYGTNNILISSGGGGSHSSSSSVSVSSSSRRTSHSSSSRGSSGGGSYSLGGVNYDELQTGDGNSGSRTFYKHSRTSSTGGRRTYHYGTDGDHYTANYDPSLLNPDTNVLYQDHHYQRER